MVRQFVRSMGLLMGTLLFAMFVAACGGQSATSTSSAAAVPAETPEQRVKGFFSTFSDAVSDPKLTEEATKTEWLTKLGDYIEPSAREATRTKLEETFGQFTGFDIAQLTGQAGLDVQMEIRFDITETKLVEEAGDKAKVEIIDGTLSMKPTGADVEKLGETATMLTQSAPISEFFGEAGSEQRIINLVKVDGVWYLADAF